MTLANHSAAGSNAGFSYQFERALHWLAKSPSGFKIGIETADDVAIQTNTGSAILEQDKHSIRKDGQPFGDRSTDLWNTLAIWVLALDEREIPESSRFLMVTNKVLPNCIARQIGEAQTDPDIAACVRALEQAAQNPSQGIAKLVSRVLRTESRANLHRIIAQCEVADASKASAGEALLAETTAHLPLPGWCRKHAVSIADELLGWLHRTALALWQEGKPAWIDRDHFVEQLHAILDRRRREVARERAEHLIPVPPERIGETKASRFVRQLYLVTEDNDIVDTAIREFIRCSIEKTRLSIEGNITDEDWRGFETVLLSRWQKIRSRLIRMREGQPPKDTGFAILAETTENYRERLAGSETEQVYLTAGTYHRLADLVSLGWHPDFANLMKPD